MINLLTGQPLFIDVAWAVKAGGDYAPDELVEVYRVSDPKQVVAYYAQFVAEGTYP